MRALVTGVAGFIGSSIAEELVHFGWDVVGVDSFTDYYSRALKVRNLQSFLDEIDFREVDIVATDCDELLSGVSIVFHQAGQPGVRGSWGAQFAEYADRNIIATQKLLEASQRSSTLECFVYASSSSIYGDADIYPVDEDARPMPHSPYGVSKLAAEHLCTLYARNFGLPTVSLRYFTVYGPRQRPDMAFTRFLLSANSGAPITIYGNGEQVRDFTYVSDVVSANLVAATSGLAPGTVLNVSGGSNASINQVLQQISELVTLPLDVRYTASAVGDVKRTGGSTKRIERLLAWRPEIDLLKGLRLQNDWVQKVSTR